MTEHLSRSAGSGDGTALYLQDQALVELLTSIDWDFADADTRHSGHSIHPYPAKFPPQIPETAIELFSKRGELVLDCFGGSGTTALEATRLQRRAASIDANPIADLVTRVKLAELTDEVDRSIARLRSRLGDPASLRAVGVNAWRPQIPNIDRWYDAGVVDELAGIRSAIGSWSEDDAATSLAMLAFAATAARLSFQDSETRYKSVPRNVESGEAMKAFESEMDGLLESLRARSPVGAELRLITSDARERTAYPFGPGEVDLVVTSPPYPNAYDYHLYHRFRIFWLGEDPGDLRRVEVGSHLTNQALGDAIGRYERDMLAVLDNVARVLRAGRFAVFVVGDGVHEGVSYPTGERLARLADLVGFTHVVSVQRRLPNLRRSVTVAGRRLQEETVLVLRKPDALTDRPSPPNYERFPYEVLLAAKEIEALSNRTGESPHEFLRQAAFSYAVTIGSDRVATLQRAAENDRSSVTKKKNSTYGSHGLHRYKGKFYPQLAKALINIGDPYRQTGVVCDPFGGSGTVALEARLAGLDVVSIDRNPLAAFVAEAKFSFVEVPAAELKELADEVLASCIDDPLKIDWTQFAPEVHDELVSWFAEPVLARLSSLLRGIRSLASDRRRPHVDQATKVFLVVVSNLIRDVSGQEPTDLRIRRRFKPLEDAPVSEIWSKQISQLIDRRRALEPRLLLGPPLGHGAFVCGDATSAKAFAGTKADEAGIACVVSSPPYGVALPYLDTDRLSLAAIFGISRSQRKDLERELIGSREITTRDLHTWDATIGADAASLLPLSTRCFLEDLKSAVDSDGNAGFRRRQTPAVLARYFALMDGVIRQLVKRLNPGAEVALVLGDSRTTISGKRWTIPTVDEVAAIAKDNGLALVEEIPITVTREGLLNARNSIVHNSVLRFRNE